MSVLRYLTSKAHEFYLQVEAEKFLWNLIGLIGDVSERDSFVRIGTVTDGYLIYLLVLRHLSLRIGAKSPTRSGNGLQYE